MGQIRKRGAFYQIRYYRNGQRIEESTKHTKYDDARTLLNQREGDIANGVPLSAKMGQIRFTEAAADLLTNYRINQRKSTGDVERHVAKLTQHLGTRRMADITTADAEAYALGRLKDGAANATVNRELASLKRCFTLAVRARKLVVKPHIPMLEENNVRTGFFEHEQFVSVRSNLSARLRGIATMAYYTGWRAKSEILPLQWSQVDRKNGVIRLEVGTTKNKRGRTFKYVHLTELNDVIDAQHTEHEALKKANRICPFVFQRKGKPVKSWRKAWNAACKLAGCPGRKPHDFRRTAVRNLTRAGVTDTIAMAVTGHRTRAVFDRYDITSEADLDDAAAKLQSFVAGTKTGTNATSENSANADKATA